MTTIEHDVAPGALEERRFPPVAYLGMASMACIVAGGIYLAANLPEHVPLGPAVGLLVAGAGLLLAGAVALASVRAFAWRQFFMVASRTLLAYVVTAGMIEYVFVYDHTRGRVLLVMTLMLVVFALDVPMILAFTVARYQPADTATT